MKKQRHAGDKTRQQILNAAKALFVKQGFAATSVSQIAKRSASNQSLIYHHFKDKSSLWRLVKESQLQEYLQELNTLFQNTELSGTEFIRTLLRTRIDTFLKKPDIQKMLYWQLIESNRNLRHTPNHNPEIWLLAVKRLQARHQFKPQLDPEAILALLASSMNGLMIYINLQCPTPKQIKAYRTLAEEACIVTIVHKEG